MKSLAKFVMLMAVFQQLLFVRTSAEDATPPAELTPPTEGESGADSSSATTLGDGDTDTTTTADGVENPTTTDVDESKPSLTAVGGGDEDKSDGDTTVATTTTVEAPPTTTTSSAPPTLPTPSSSSTSSTPSSSSTSSTPNTFAPDMTEAELNKTLNDLSTVYDVLTTYQGLFTDITPTPIQGDFKSRSSINPTDESEVQLTTRTIDGKKMRGIVVDSTDAGDVFVIPCGKKKQNQCTYLWNLILVVGIILFISQLLVLACIIVYVRKSVNESRSWDPPPIRYGSVSSQYRADIDMTKKGQKNLALELADEEEPKTDEMKEKKKKCSGPRCSGGNVAVPINITNEEGWCVPYAPAEETDVPLQTFNQSQNPEGSKLNSHSCSP